MDLAPPLQPQRLLIKLPARALQASNVAPMRHCAACSEFTSLAVLRCAKCPRAFHLFCVQEAFEEVPKSEWMCNKCRKRSEKEKTSKSKTRTGTGFAKLVSRLAKTNPKDFAIPRLFLDAKYTTYQNPTLPILGIPAAVSVCAEPPVVPTGPALNNEDDTASDTDLPTRVTHFHPLEPPPQLPQASITHLSHLRPKSSASSTPRSSTPTVTTYPRQSHRILNAALQLPPSGPTTVSESIHPSTTPATTTTSRASTVSVSRRASPSVTPYFDDDEDEGEGCAVVEVPVVRILESTIKREFLETVKRRRLERKQGEMMARVEGSVV
ncbi:hypothetical protein HDU98_011061 [Podochytrium sp. JEL0797]|nr:hypothetical protein HDU98_011061 [Podochytrium sp. JEL0797]